MMKRKLIKLKSEMNWAKSSCSTGEWKIIDDTRMLQQQMAHEPKGFNYSVFYHELSEFMDEHTKYRAMTSQTETTVYNQFKTTSPQRYSVEMLSELASLLTGNHGRIRNHDIGLEEDTNGRSVKFPHARYAKQRLKDIVGLMNEQKQTCFNQAVYVYVYVYVLLLNAHPFTDGNGRVARVLFNLLINQHENHYLPLYDFKFYSNGGYEIRLREAKIYDRWTGLLRYFKNCIQFTNLHL